jgi:anti-sigma factor RsiW
MSCKFEAELTAYLDGELNPAATAAVRAHLAGCADCRATEGLLRSTVETLRTLPAFEPSGDLRRNVLTRLDRLPPALGARLRAVLRPVVLVPSALALVAAALVLQARTTPSSELLDGAGLAVAMNFEVANDYEVLGLDSPEDVEVVAHLQELEARQ